MTHHSLHKITGKIRKLRQDAGYKSHEDFALEVPMNRSSYCKLEGNAPNMTMKTLLRILSVHNVTLKEFFSDIE